MLINHYQNHIQFIFISFYFSFKMLTIVVKYQNVNIPPNMNEIKTMTEVRKLTFISFRE